MVTRVKSGIKEFDKIVSGGFPINSAVLVAGAPGTGKSIFCQQILFNNALKGKKGLYVSFEQSEEDVFEQMEMFGFEARKMEKAGKFKVLALKYESTITTDKVLQELKRGKYKLLVMDSLSSIAPSPQEKSDFDLSLEQIEEKVIPTLLDPANIVRLKIKQLIDQIKNVNVTSFLISEILSNSDAYSRDEVSEFICDGIIVLKLNRFGKDVTRIITMEKMRNTNIDARTHLFEFTKEGIKLL